LEPEHIRTRQSGGTPGVWPLLEGWETALVVLGDPGLDGAARAPEVLGDLRGGAALLGEDDGLVTEPEPFLGEGFGPLLEFFEGVVVLDKLWIWLLVESRGPIHLAQSAHPAEEERTKFPDSV